MAEHAYVYVLVRKDIPLHQQLVQAGHAAFEAGLRWHSPDDEVASLIVLEVPHRAALMRAATKFAKRGIEHHVFLEPDFGIGESALATQPLAGEARRLLAGYPLWNGASACRGHGDPAGSLETAETAEATESAPVPLPGHQHVSGVRHA